VIKGSKRFFFKKKKQKISGPAGSGDGGANARSKQKFFAARRPGSFFQKRSAFL
jgi:hypothetical protein